MLLIGVEPVGRLVQNQDLRIVNQRLCQTDTAAKTLGQGFDDLPNHRRKSKPVDDDGAANTPPLAGEAAHVGDEIQELGHGHFAVAGSAFREITHAGLGGHRRALDIVTRRPKPGRRRVQ